MDTRGNQDTALHSIILVIIHSSFHDLALFTDQYHYDHPSDQHDAGGGGHA